MKTNSRADYETVASILLDTLQWDETEEGYDYWDDVYEKLVANAKRPEILNQYEIANGSKFNFVGDSIRDEELGPYMKVDLHAGFASTRRVHFMEVKTSEVFQFRAEAETLVAVD